MQIAIAEARRGAENGEVPVGAAVYDPATDTVLAQSANRTKALGDPAAHAEFLAMREAVAKYGAKRILNCDLYVTLEPCTMCAGAIAHYRMRRLYFGAYDPKGGGVDHGARFFNQPTCHHRPEVYGGIQERDCGDLLREFFQSLRD